MTNTKIGRPRRYDLQPAPGFTNHTIALAIATLDELLERVLDQFDDLPQEALDFAPSGTPLTIGALVIHLAWAEMSWIERTAPASIPDDLRTRLDPGHKVPKGESVTSSETAPELVTLCRRVRDEVTYPALAMLADVDTVIDDPQRPLTPRGVLMHLIWHWTYHSAHIGLLRELWGSDYIWTFGNLGV